MSKYDIAMIGHICRDIITESGTQSFAPGGAVYYSAIAAARSGSKVFVLSKAGEDADSLYREMRESGVTVESIASPETTSMECIYRGENKERRDIVHISSADNFTVEDLNQLPEASVYHIAGLVAGEVEEALLTALSSEGKTIAMDIQTMIRHSREGSLAFRDWERKKDFLPQIHFLKTDAAEAEILTGMKNRRKAAEKLASWGCREIMITHNSEVMIHTDGRFFSAPFTAKKLPGRSGRGDTTFAAYIAERLSGRSPREAVEYAAALCSIKMEEKGPFKGSRSDVSARIERDGAATS